MIGNNRDLPSNWRQFVMESRDFGCSSREFVKNCDRLARRVSDGRQLLDSVIDAPTNRHQVQVDLMEQVSDGILARFLPSKFRMFLTS
jgi:hypothetical protein